MANTIVGVIVVALLGLWLHLTLKHREHGRAVPAPWKGFFVLATILLFVTTAALPQLAYPRVEADSQTGKSLQICRQNVDEASQLYEKSIAELAQEVPDDVGICFYDPKEDLTIEHNATKVFEMASIYKLYVAWAVLDDVQTGKRTLADKVPAFGGSVQQGIKDMITWSDNDSAEAFGQMVTWRRVDDLLHSKGLKDSTFHPSKDGKSTNRIESTPRDVTIFLAMLDRGSILDESRTAFLIDMLLQQKLNNTLSPGLPDKVRYGHKTGWLDDTFNDAGIIYLGERPFYISVMTTGWTSGNATAEEWYARLGYATGGYIKAAGNGKEWGTAPINDKFYDNSLYEFNQWMLYNRTTPPSSL